MKTKVLTLSLALLFGSISYCRACTCMSMLHPQEHYCRSDFVILARVKKEQLIQPSNQIYGFKVYKVRVRKHFKVSEKGLVALKSGRLHTATYDSLCGVNLEVGKLYVLSGNIESLRAKLNLCDSMVMEWDRVSRRQRKGLRSLYKSGCNCSIKNCMFHKCHSRQKDTCNWTSKCETLDGVCHRQRNGSCMWNKNKALASCRLGQQQHRNSSVYQPIPRQELPRIPLEMIP